MPRTKAKKKASVKQPSVRTLKIKLGQLTKQVQLLKEKEEASSLMRSRNFKELVTLTSLAKHLHQENERHFNQLQDAQKTINDFEATIRVITKNEGFGYRVEGIEILPSFDVLKKQFESVSIWKDQSLTSKQ